MEKGFNINSCSSTGFDAGGVCVWADVEHTEIESATDTIQKAEAVDDIETGFCGDNVSYVLNKMSGVLTISGAGDMWDIEHYINPDATDPTVVDIPVNNYYVKEIIIEPGVTSIRLWRYCSGQ